MSLPSRIPSNNHTSDIPLLTAPFLHYIPTSPPSQELDFHLPSRTPLHGLTVAEWAGTKSTRHSAANTSASSAATSINTSPLSSAINITHNNQNNMKPIVPKDSTEDNWRDVYRNIKCMDQLYDASFYSWLKSEENVLVTAMYLHRIANEYPLVRIINALKWLIGDWRLESISTLIRHVTVDWCDEAGDLRRAHLLRHLSYGWIPQYTTTLITMVLTSAPYTTIPSHHKERFLRAYTKDWDFSKLSEFFMYLQSPANIDYKVKCVMLQEAARRERETLAAKLRKKRVVVDFDSNTNNNASSSSLPSMATSTNKSSASEITDHVMDTSSSTSTSVATPTSTATAVEEAFMDPSNSASTSRRHHRRTSSNDVNDIKRLRLSTPDLDHTNPEATTHNGDNSDTSQSNNNNGTTTSLINTTRRSASPDHHHSLRCTTSNNNNINMNGNGGSSGSSSSSSVTGITLSSSSATTIGTSAATATTTSSMMSSELSHLHLGLSDTGSTSSTTESSSSSSSQDVFNTCYPYSIANASLQTYHHLRRRSSSNASESSNDMMDDPMDTDIGKKKSGGPSSLTTPFANDEAI